MMTCPILHRNISSRLAQMNLRTSPRYRAFGIYAAAAAASLVIVTVVMQLWRANLRIPFAYANSDELTVAMGAKWLIENPWIIYNPHLGMPFGTSMYDWPQPDTFYYFVFKLLGLCTSHFGVVMNLFFLATFPATALCTLWSLRQLRIGYAAALLSSLLYTFLPYHFQRGEVHLFLAAYQMVPLVCLLALRLLRAEGFFVQAASRAKLRFELHGRVAAPLAICALVGCSGTYYAFFACFLFAVAGALGCARERRVAPLLTATFLIGVIVAAGVLSVAPHLLYGHGNLAAREAADAETYGLKITQMLLPVSGHRLPALAQFKQRYYAGAPLVNENDSAALGAMGACGFLFLLALIGLHAAGVRTRWLAPEDRVYLSGAAVLALAATLLGTIGGFGSLTALVYPQIRSYNRISVFVAFFALYAVGLVLDRAVAARLRTWLAGTGYCAALALLLLFGVWDQTTRVMIPPYRATAAVFHSDQSFVYAIEAAVPRDAMIFQLPYLPYPYAARYDHAKGYLHSQQLRWSYGAMQGNKSDLWQRAVSVKPAPEMLAEVVAAGFAGVYLDREGYPDRGATLERQIATATGSKPIVSSDNRLTFFAFPPGFAATSAEIATTAEPEQLLPGDLRIQYRAGFYEEERHLQRVWHWSRAQSELRIKSPREQAVRLTMLLVTGHSQASTVKISGSLVNDEVRVNSDGARVQRKLLLPAGESILRFSCDAPPVDAPKDPRTMIFRVEDFSVTPD
jgi:phosphoglycerol transferase